VVVDVEDGDFALALVEERLGGDGSVVQVAVAAHHFTCGVMPWRAAQREGRMGALLDRCLGGKGNLGCAVRRLPGARGNRRTGIEAVIAQLTVQASGFYLAQGASRPGERQQVAFLAQCSPAGPGAFEEIQVIGAVDTQQWRPAEVGRGLDITEVALFHLVEHMVGTRRHFETGHQLAVDQLTAAVVQAVVIGIDRQHCCSPGGYWRGSIVMGRSVAENDASGQKGIDVAKVDWPVLALSPASQLPPVLHRP